MAASGTIYGVEIFQAGEARGEEYDDAYIQTLARNGVRFADTLTPTVVTGHEEGTDVPAVGAVNPKNLRAEYRMVKGKPTATLVGDFEDVPKFMADLIRTGNYRTVSAEIYPDHEGAGPTLRRVAILGGEIPQIKTLANLREIMARQPVDAFCESGTCPAMALQFTRQTKTSAGTVLCFSEVTPMDPTTQTTGISRDELIAALGESGVDVTTITDTVPDSLLAEVLRVVKMQGEQQASEDAVEMSDDEKAKKEADDKAVAEAKRKEEEDKMNAEQTKKFSEQIASANAIAEKAKADAAEAKAAAEKANKYAEQLQADNRKARIVATVDKARDEGRLAPAMRDAKIAELEAADHATVRKFGEKEMTALDFALNNVATTPKAVTFGPKTKTAATGETEQDAETYKVRKFAEENIATIKKTGRTVDDYVNTFKRLQAKNPTLTAAEHLGAAAVA